MTSLLTKKCALCEWDADTLNPADIAAFLTHIPLWSVKNNHEIARRFKFKNFAEALAFVNKVGALAESEGHHPDISFGWGHVEVTTFTHAVDGLSENDFILAAKIDTLVSSSSPL